LRVWEGKEGEMNEREATETTFRDLAIGNWEEKRPREGGGEKKN